MTQYKIEFPRFGEDIASGRRTLVHLPALPDVPEIKQGDTMVIVQRRENAFGIQVTVTSVSKVALDDSLVEDQDWVLLNLAPPQGFRSSSARADALIAYSTRWDSTNPDAPWGSSPTVWRIVFSYPDAFLAAT